MSPEEKIFYEGALSGIFSGIAVKVALGADASSIPVTLYNSFCRATKNIQPAFDCTQYITALAIIAAALTLLTFIEALKRADSKIHAALTYAVSYFIGLILIMLFV